MNNQHREKAVQQATPVFEVFNVTQVFQGKQILSIDHLAFHREKIYCLYGPNGSGKTTLFELLLLLRKPASGKVFFCGQELFPKGLRLSGMRSRVTLVQQHPLLFDTTVEKNVDYGLRVRGQHRRLRQQRVQECLNIVGLDGFQKRKARQISGGEAQRVAIARALAIRPEVLFLDEFSANIDYENRVVLEDIMKTVNKKFRTTILFTTHYRDQAYRLADSVVHLLDGRAVEGQVRNLFRGDIHNTEQGKIFQNGHVRLVVTSTRQGAATVNVPLNAITVSAKPLESSMRNTLTGRVAQLIDDGAAVLVRVDAGEMFEATITKESMRSMQLEPGREVYLSFKATAVEVL